MKKVSKKILLITSDGLTVSSAASVFVVVHRTETHWKGFVAEFLIWSTTPLYDERCRIGTCRILFPTINHLNTSTNSIEMEKWKKRKTKIQTMTTSTNNNNTRDEEFSLNFSEECQLCNFYFRLRFFIISSSPSLRRTKLKTYLCGFVCLGYGMRRFNGMRG